MAANAIKIKNNVSIGTTSTPTLNVSKVVTEMAVRVNRGTLTSEATGGSEPWTVTTELGGEVQITYYTSPTAASGASAMAQMVWDAVVNGTNLYVSGTADPGPVSALNPKITVEVCPTEVMLFGRTNSFGQATATWPMADPSAIVRATS
ncbi:MAG: hypothetical protein KDB40_11000 [Acidimicrobiales bacterium]|nr:hypothetical protein [Acidimicrobiales bacterium]MCB9393806.1 hypothetical protein [Acidimicrobiaceae bacterium]